MKKVILLTMVAFAIFVLFAEATKYHKVDPQKCIGCTICVQKCPVKAITMQDGKAVIDREKCIQCGLCIQACPVSAISVVEEAAVTVDSVIVEPDSTEVVEPEEAPSTGMIEMEEDESPVVEEIEAQIASTYYAVDESKCIGCMVCPRSCPVDAIEMRQGTAKIDTGKCIRCGLCEKDCPVKAIALVQAAPNE